MAWVTPKTNWTSADGVAAADINRIEANILSLKPVVINVTLPAASWTGTAAPYTQTVAASNVTATNNITVAIASGATPAQYVAASDAQLHPSAQGAATITVKAMAVKPTVNIPITICTLD